MSTSHLAGSFDFSMASVVWTEPPGDRNGSLRLFLLSRFLPGPNRRNGCRASCAIPTAAYLRRSRPDRWPQVITNFHGSAHWNACAASLRLILYLYQDNAKSIF